MTRSPSLRRLGQDDTRLILDIAIEAVGHALRTGHRDLPGLADLPPRLREEGASFVTLRRRGHLLGCIGTLEPYQPLGVDVAEHALGAAFDDPRVPPIDVDDFEQMSVEVSVLGPLRPLDVHSHEELVAALRPGVDGLLVAAPRHRATFLPGVWHSVSGPEEFLALLWRKAGLWPGEWPPGMRLSVYQVEEYADAGPRKLRVDA